MVKKTFKKLMDFEQWKEQNIKNKAAILFCIFGDFFF